MQTSNETSYELPDLSHSMGEHLGIVFQEMKDGYVKASMPVDERSCQPFGVLNGGASLALAEIVAGHGSIPLCAASEMPCGIRSAPITSGWFRWAKPSLRQNTHPPGKNLAYLEY